MSVATSIKVARANNLVSSMLLDKVDHLRLIRNPFVHLKSFEHEHTIGQRSLQQQVVGHNQIDVVLAKHLQSPFRTGCRQDRISLTLQQKGPAYQRRCLIID